MVTKVGLDLRRELLDRRLSGPLRLGKVTHPSAS